MIDRYTKAVLTVIAAALVAIATQNGINSLHAESGTPQKVVICDPQKPDICANLQWGPVGRYFGLMISDIMR